MFPYLYSGSKKKYYQKCNNLMYLTEIKYQSHLSPRELVRNLQFTIVITFTIIITLNKYQLHCRWLYPRRNIYYYFLVKLFTITFYKHVANEMIRSLRRLLNIKFMSYWK